MIVRIKNKKKLNSFAKQAHSYKQSSLIQSQIVQMLLASCDFTSIHRVMDIGCGCGAVALEIDKLGIKVDKFYALDIAHEMISQHPKKTKYIPHIELICEDFEEFVFDKYDVVFAASSLQWAQDLDSVMYKIAKSSHMVRFAIHTNKSLDSVHRFLGTSSPLRDKKCLESILQKYFNGKIWIEKLERNFTNRQDFLGHLKESGLLGGGVLNFSQARYFRNNIPFAKIEYEVLMFAGVSKFSFR
ncbi:class I SAM-dependent methyltransferase [Helicobacter cappadocius]|uniref:Class I SAM-dependent methyltransferase n=1 Tax=Helicobacter cappadocius TaxID=3063998 RepID=A0AA90PS07_9HELI|nr:MULTISPECIES: class I SAM-dependent methyltransferase [unclassified Helicobacter]MDO7252958.1 class I SAM-dependent methyltransferase [Helicobacter sp. faydin-H75]MDP2539052.1 class I SAM-dependent methyltransferase [Helicobacter sp. faydin-H76]